MASSIKLTLSQDLPATNLDVLDLDNVQLLQGERVLGVVDAPDEVENFPLVKLVLKTKPMVINL